MSFFFPWHSNQGNCTIWCWFVDTLLHMLQRCDILTFHTHKRSVITYALYYVLIYLHPVNQEWAGCFLKSCISCDRQMNQTLKIRWLVCQDQSQFFFFTLKNYMSACLTVVSFICIDIWFSFFNFLNWWKIQSIPLPFNFVNVCINLVCVSSTYYLSWNGHSFILSSILF